MAALAGLVLARCGGAGTKAEGGREWPVTTCTNKLVRFAVSAYWPDLVVEASVSIAHGGLVSSPMPSGFRRELVIGRICLCA